MSLNFMTLPKTFEELLEKLETLHGITPVYRNELDFYVFFRDSSDPKICWTFYGNTESPMSFSHGYKWLEVRKNVRPNVKYTNFEEFVKALCE